MYYAAVRSAALILLHSPAGLTTEKWPVALKVAAGCVKTKATLGPTTYCCHGRAIGGLAAGAELKPIRQWKMHAASQTYFLRLLFGLLFSVPRAMPFTAYDGQLENRAGAHHGGRVTTHNSPSPGATVHQQWRAVIL
jgi:hypothetical protein